MLEVGRSVFSSFVHRVSIPWAANSAVRVPSSHGGSRWFESSAAHSTYVKLGYRIGYRITPPPPVGAGGEGANPCGSARCFPWPPCEDLRWPVLHAPGTGRNAPPGTSP